MHLDELARQLEYLCLTKRLVEGLTDALGLDFRFAQHGRNQNNLAIRGELGKQRFSQVDEAKEVCVHNGECESIARYVLVDAPIVHDDIEDGARTLNPGGVVLDAVELRDIELLSLDLSARDGLKQGSFSSFGLGKVPGGEIDVVFRREHLRELEP